MCRAATRWTGSASSGISTARLVSCCLNRTAPDPPHSAASGSAGIRVASSSGVPSQGPHSDSPSAEWTAAATSPRRASRTVRQRRPPAASPSPRASASSVPTPPMGRLRLSPSARAVAIPTRRPVKEPGPIPTARRSTAPQPPAASAARSTSASSAVVCCGPPFSERPSSASYRASPSRAAATAVSAVAVSKPTAISVRYPGTVKAKEPTRSPSTNHVTLCLPGIVEVILFTYSWPFFASCFGLQRFFLPGNLTQTE
jgi:hypothetical protein